jgi:hypothetical protein
MRLASLFGSAAVLIGLALALSVLGCRSLCDGSEVRAALRWFGAAVVVAAAARIASVLDARPEAPRSTEPTETDREKGPL